VFHRAGGAAKACYIGLVGGHKSGEPLEKGSQSYFLKRERSGVLRSSHPGNLDSVEGQGGGVGGRGRSSRLRSLSVCSPEPEIPNTQRKMRKSSRGFGGLIIVFSSSSE